MIYASTSVWKSNNIASVPIPLIYCYYYPKNYNEAFYYHYRNVERSIILCKWRRMPSRWFSIKLSKHAQISHRNRFIIRTHNIWIIEITFPNKFERELLERRKDINIDWWWSKYAKCSSFSRILHVMILFTIT